jgi:chromosome segregation ATPase
MAGASRGEDADGLMMQAAKRIKQLEADLKEARAAQAVAALEVERARKAHRLAEGEVMTLRKALLAAEARAAAADIAREGETLFALAWPYTADLLKARYTALMKRVHPDVAGPNGVAQRLNAGRDAIAKLRGWAL